MTREIKSEALATYIRQRLHKDAASDFHHNDTTKSVEIDIVHPVHGPRIVAFSDELLDDNDLNHITQLVDQCGIIEDLDEEHYLPIIITNYGSAPYRA